MARSRRGTPSAQTAVPASTAPAGRAGRSRSATHEAAPAPAATQPATASTRRSTRAKSVESNASAASRGGRSRRRVDAPQEIPQVDLTTVEEHSEDEEVFLDIPEPDDVPEVRGSQEDAEDAEEAVGDQSHAMSGTTARDQFSQDGDNYELSPYVLLAHAPAAYHAATDLIKRFDSHKPVLVQVLKGIDNPDSSNATGFRQDCEALHDALSQLGEEFTAQLLHADTVMESLFKQSLPNKLTPSWLITELIYLFNLAITAKSIGEASDSDGLDDQIQKLDGLMPLPFLKDIDAEDSPYIVGHSRLMDETFEASLAIRLQSVVLQIQQTFGEDGFDLDEVVNSTLRMGGTDRNLRAWDVNALGDGNQGLLPEYHKKMERRIKRLHDAVREDELDIEEGSEDGLQLLAKNFPWTDFRVTTLRWAKLRMEEIVAAIEGTGGIKKLMEQVHAELSKDESFDTNYVLPQTRTPIKNRGARPASRQSSLAMVSPSSQRGVNGNTGRPRFSQRDDFQPHQDEDEVAEDTQTMDVLSTYDKDRAQRKENLAGRSSGKIRAANRAGRFVPPQSIFATQEDAERITDFNTQGTQDEERRPQAASRKTSGKRKQQADSDVSGDEGFEQDTRQIDESQNRRNAPQLASPNKRVRIEEPTRSASGIARRREEGRADDPAVREYAEQKQIMKDQQALPASQRQPRPNLGRVRWSNSEEYALEQMITEHGCSWALIKDIDSKTDQHFEGRDQVALKDKARNMKVAYILGGLDPLPRNWELVPLDKKAIERLVRANIDADILHRAGVDVRRVM